MASPCDSCKAVGLPILLARYAPVPSSMAQRLPPWASAEGVKDVVVGPDYHYALRALRSGYLYLLYEKHPRSANYWECYTISQSGELVRQSNPTHALPPDPKLLCTNPMHSALRTEFIVIEKPKECGTVWIAYSQHKWSDLTRKKYGSDKTLRAARMQSIDPAKLAATTKPSAPHLCGADINAIESILDYAPQFDQSGFPFATKPTGRISTHEDGSFDVQQLKKQSTSCPWLTRAGHASKTLKSMQLVGRKADATPTHGVVMALWDFIGTANELKDFRTEPAGRIEQYLKEHDQQIHAMNSIAGLKLALNKKIDDTYDQRAKNHIHMNDGVESGMRQRAVETYANNPQELGPKIYDLDQQYTQGSLPPSSYTSQRTILFKKHCKNPAGMEKAYGEIDRHRLDLKKKRENARQSHKQYQWDRYKSLIDTTSLEKFEKNYDKFLVNASSLIDGRTPPLLNCLDSSQFEAALEDYDTSKIEDGVAFESTIGDIVFGLGSSKKGADKIDAWVANAKASNKKNLLWRAIALNQKEGIEIIDQALAYAVASPKALTQEAWDNVGGQVKWNKLADLYKKAQTLWNTNLKTGVTAVGTIKLGVEIDKLLITTGDRIFKPFVRVFDTVNEKTIQTILALRAGVEPKIAEALLKAQLKYETIERDAFLRRLANNLHYDNLDDAAKARQAELSKAWKSLKDGANVPGQTGAFNAAKDARLALIVAMFEGINLWKISQKADNNPKIRAQLIAARLATSSAALDVLSNVIKGLVNDRAVSFQVLKLAGGVLSASASLVGSALDFGEAKKASSEDNLRMAIFYYERSGFQFLSAGLTILTSLSYASPLIEAFGERYAARFVGKIATQAAIRLLAMRAALFLATIEVSIFVLFVTTVIWFFEDDALQKWCKHSAFGINHTPNGYKTMQEQAESFDKAFQEVI